MDLSLSRPIGRNDSTITYIFLGWFQLQRWPFSSVSPPQSIRLIILKFLLSGLFPVSLTLYSEDGTCSFFLRRYNSIHTIIVCDMTIIYHRVIDEYMIFLRQQPWQNNLRYFNLIVELSFHLLNLSDILMKSGV